MEWSQDNFRKFTNKQLKHMKFDVVKDNVFCVVNYAARSDLALWTDSVLTSDYSCQLHFKKMLNKHERL